MAKKTERDRITHDLINLLESPSDNKSTQENLENIIERIINDNVITKTITRYARKELISEYHDWKIIPQKDSDRKIEHFRQLAKYRLLEVFCKLPQDVGGKILSYQEFPEERKIVIQQTVGLYTSTYIDIIKYYLHLVLINMKGFPLFGLEYKAFKDFLTWEIKYNRRKSKNEKYYKSEYKRRLLNAYWEAVPADIKDSDEQQLKSDKIYKHIINLIPNRRTLTNKLNQLKKTDVPTLSLCFTDSVIENAQSFLHELYDRIFNNDYLLIIKEIRQTIIRSEDSYKTSLSEFKNLALSDPKEQYPEDEEDKALRLCDISVNAVLYFVLKGLTPIVEEYYSYNEGSKDVFVKEYLPVLKAHEGFEETFPEFKKVSPRRWQPTHDKRSDIFNFAWVALKNYFENTLSKKSDKASSQEMQNDDKNDSLDSTSPVSYNLGYTEKGKEINVKQIMPAGAISPKLSKRDNDSVYDENQMGGIKCFEDMKKPKDSHERFYCSLIEFATSMGYPENTARKYFDRFIREGEIELGSDVNYITFKGTKKTRIIYEDSLDKVKDLFWQKRKRYTIKEFSEKVNLHPDTIRRWEKKGVLHPLRDKNKYRVYTDEHIKEIRNFLLQNPRKIDRIKKKLKS